LAVEKKTFDLKKADKTFFLGEQPTKYPQFVEVTDFFLGPEFLRV